MVYSIDHHVCDQKLRTAQPRELADLKEYGAQHLLVRAISGIRAVRGIRAVCGIHEVSGIHAVSNSSSTSSDIRRRFTVVAWRIRTSRLLRESYAGHTHHNRLVRIRPGFGRLPHR